MLGIKEGVTMLIKLLNAAEWYYYAIFRNNDNFTREGWESDLGEMYEECRLAGHSKTTLDKVIALAYKRA